MSTGSFTVCRATKVVFAAILAFATAGPPAALADPASPVAITQVDSPDPVSFGGPAHLRHHRRQHRRSRIDNVVLSDQLNGVGGIGVPPQLAARQLARKSARRRHAGHLQRRHDRRPGELDGHDSRDRHRCQRHGDQQHGRRSAARGRPRSSTPPIPGPPWWPAAAAPTPISPSTRSDRECRRLVGHDLHVDREQLRHRRTRPTSWSWTRLPDGVTGHHRPAAPASSSATSPVRR